jgi:hypothetical protein
MTRVQTTKIRELPRFCLEIGALCVLKLAESRISIFGFRRGHGRHEKGKSGIVALIFKKVSVDLVEILYAPINLQKRFVKIISL